MNTRLIGTTLLLAVGLSACGGGGGGGGTTPALVEACGAPTTATLPVVTVSSAITTPTTWNASSVYYISGNINVDAALTILPGAVVKFITTRPGGAMLVVGTNGSITANGDSSKSIVFTSYKDDSVGGDSDGVLATPVVGDWGKIALESSGSSFNCVKFAYGGKTNSTLDIGHGFTSTPRSATVTNSTFAHNNGGDVNGLVDVTINFIKVTGALDASLAAAATVITGNTFYANNVPLSISGKFSIDDSNVFHDPAVPSVKNKYNGIFQNDQSGTSFIGAINYTETEVPFVLAGLSNVPDGSQLTLGDNVVIKFFASSSTLNTIYNNNGSTVPLNLSAKIIANASPGKKIVFTSYKDDAHGGDTNGDGTATTPAMSDWDGILLHAHGSSFDRAEFYYSGGSTVSDGALRIHAGYTATVKNSIFAHNNGGTPDIAWGVLNAARAAAGTIITGNTFYNNKMPLVISGQFSMDDSNVFHNPANPTVTNLYNGIFMTGTHLTAFDTISLAETEVAYAFKGIISLLASKTLTLGNDVVIKFYDPLTQFQVAGTLNVGTNVHFTSLYDDTYKGKTSGAATGPTKGDWLGVRDVVTSGTPWIAPAMLHYNKCNHVSDSGCV